MGGLEVCRLVQPVRVVEDRLIHEKDLEIIGYLSAEKCLWEHEGDYDTPEKFKEELGKKRAATTRLSALFFQPRRLSLCMATRSLYRPCSK